MGNCIRCHHESQVHWGGEDWTPALTLDEDKPDEGVSKRESLDSKPVSTEVKIKITKKQLEKFLLSRDHLLLQEPGSTVQQALSQLIRLSAHYEAVQHRPGWRPRLHSIPEV